MYEKTQYKISILRLMFKSNSVERLKENRNANERRTDRQTDRRMSLPFLNFSVSSITRLIMAASKMGVRGGQ